MTSPSLSSLVSIEQLQAITGYDRWGDVTRCLDTHGIRYFLGKGGRPWTTVDIINAAAGVLPTYVALQPKLYGAEIL